MPISRGCTVSIDSGALVARVKKIEIGSRVWSFMPDDDINQSTDMENQIFGMYSYAKTTMQIGYRKADHSTLVGWLETPTPVEHVIVVTFRSGGTLTWGAALESMPTSLAGPKDLITSELTFVRISENTAYTYSTGGGVLSMAPFTTSEEWKDESK